MSRAIPILLVLLLLGGGCETLDNSSHEITGFFNQLTDHARGRTPRAAALKLEDPYFPDERREGLNELVKTDFGKRPPYTTRYEQIAQTDDGDGLL